MFLAATGVAVVAQCLGRAVTAEVLTVVSSHRSLFVLSPPPFKFIFLLLLRNRRPGATAFMGDSSAVIHGVSLGGFVYDEQEPHS